MKRMISLSLFLVGITATSAQIVLLREFLATFYGNELAVGILMFVWLAGGAAGAWAGSMARKWRILAKPGALALCHAILLALIPSAVIFLRISRPLTGLIAGEIAGMPVIAVASIICFFPICFTTGLMFVIGCLAYGFEEGDRRIGRVYFLESAGASAGGLITGLCLVPYFGILEICLMIGLLNGMMAVLMLWFLSRIWRPVAAAVIVMLAAVSFVSGRSLADYIGRITLGYKWKGFDVLGSGDSIYGSVTMARMGDQYTLFSNGIISSSSPDLIAAEENVHFAMLMHPDPRNVLLIGGGTGDTLGELLKYPQAAVTYVEIDPLLIEMARKFMKGEPWFELDNPRVRIVNQDARYYVKTARDKYDVVILQLPNPYNAQIDRLYTADFYAELKDLLNEPGIVSFGITSSENYISPQLSHFLYSLEATLKTVFSDVRVIPGDTAFYLASTEKGRLTLDSTVIEERRGQKGIEASFVTPFYLRSKLSRDRISYLNSVLAAAARVEKPFINTDFHPVSYYYDMVLWSTYFSGAMSWFFDALDKTCMPAVITIFGLLLITGFAARRC
ncbi:MAG: spermidine synthase, partial [Candidatus Omnitrophota bacterium]